MRSEDENRKEFKSRVEQEAYDLFGEMRDFTEEESKAYEDSLKAISKPTGRNIYDIMEKLESDKIVDTGITFEDLLGDSMYEN